ILVDGASRSIDVDTNDSVVTTTLGAAATGTGETIIVGGMKVNQRHEETINSASCRASAHKEIVVAETDQGTFLGITSSFGCLGP
nr:hypothetical protein [Tanacetum cinerariifolium]